jgi:transaldolase
MADMLTLLRHGQSVWLDYIVRDLIEDGGLKELIGEGLRGVTSNPTIFHKAITASQAYDEAIREMLDADPAVSPQTLYDELTVADVQTAADLLAPTYEDSQGADGYVSLEVSPRLANDTFATMDAVRTAWKAVDRPNLMVKVPGTRAGLPAIERLTCEGYNINVTLLFSVQRYAEVAQAYVRGLAMNPEPQRVASVASFFVSRIDTKVDRLLVAIGGPEAKALRGRAAIASAKLAYQHYKAIFSGEAFAEQRERGARVQRLLWGSTSTKDKRYRDVRYVEELIGQDTVNTVPPATLDAFLAHGEVADTLDRDVDRAREDLGALDALRIHMEQVTRELEDEGVQAFIDSYDALLEALKERRDRIAREYAG